MAPPKNVFGIMQSPATKGLLPLPGITRKTTDKLTELLQKNHVDNDMYFNEMGFHNHLGHHLLAAYSLGASSETLERHFKVQSDIQLPMGNVISYDIDDQNWTKYIGNRKAYSSYLIFFNSVIEKEGVVKAIENYCFQDKRAKMTLRLIGGLLHPLIHVGYGLEFGIPGHVAEGLAQMATTKLSTAENMFDPEWPNQEFESLERQIDKVRLEDEKPNFLETSKTLQRFSRKPRKGLSAFDIVNDILKDERLAAGKTNTYDDPEKLRTTMETAGHIIKEHCEKWVIDHSAGWTEIVEKTEEIFWLTTVLVASTTRPGYKPVQDFSLAHCCTSALFLPSYLEIINPSSRIVLLHEHFRTIIATWIAKGRPQLHIKDVLMAATDKPTSPKAKIINKDLPESLRVSVWTNLIDNAINHSDEHVTKLLRTYIICGTWFGEAQQGIYKSSLPETELLDGTIFARASGILLDTLGWSVGESGSLPGFNWDRGALGYDEAWN